MVKQMMPLNSAHLISLSTSWSDVLIVVSGLSSANKNDTVVGIDSIKMEADNYRENGIHFINSVLLRNTGI